MHEVRGGPGTVVGGMVVGGDVVGGDVVGDVVGASVVAGSVVCGGAVTRGGSPPSDSWGGGDVGAAGAAVARLGACCAWVVAARAQRQQHRRWDEEGQASGAARHLGRLYAARLAR